MLCRSVVDQRRPVRSSRHRAGSAPASIRTARVEVWALMIVALLSGPCAAWAHAFPDHSEPRVGHTVDAPRAVRVWFDGALEPVFSTIRVEDGDKRRVDSGDGRVNPNDST